MSININILPQGTLAIYEQIIMQLKNAIVTGELRSGEALPSIRALAADLQVSVITTKRAYEELEKEGFELDGIDEELFVQDIEGIPTDSEDWDNTHPKEIFELIKSSGVLNDNYKHEIMEAYCEVRSFDEWADLVERYGENWDDDIIFYKGQDMYDVAYNLVNECYDLEKMLGNLASYFDYNAFARDLSFDGYSETERGVIEIR